MHMDPFNSNEVMMFCRKSIRPDHLSRRQKRWYNATVCKPTEKKLQGEEH